MCIYILYIHKHIYIYIYIYIYMRVLSPDAYMHVFIGMISYVVHVCICRWVSTYMYPIEHIPHMCLYTCIYVHICVYTYICIECLCTWYDRHVYIHIYIYIYTRVCVCVRVCVSCVCLRI